MKARQRFEVVMKMWVAIRIRGTQNIRREIRETLEALRLYKKNHCVIVPETPTYKGMLMRVKDYITWGEIDEKTFAKLVAARSKGEKDEKTKVFRLQPPRKGFERKGIALPFKMGGALGYRGKEINELLEKMI